MLDRRLARSAPVFALAASLGGAALGGMPFDFFLIEAFQENYDLREVYVWDINDEGTAVGTSTNLPSYGGYLWTADAGKTLIPITWPRGVNNHNVVVGGSIVLDFETGEQTFMPVPAGAVRAPQAQAINDNGFVVGYAETCQCSNSNQVQQLAFYWSASGGMHTVPVIGAKELLRINQNNVAIGNIRPSAGASRGFVFDINTGASINLSELLPPVSGGLPFSMATNINDDGVVCGEGYNGVTSAAFVWSEADGFTFLPGLLGGDQMRVRPLGINNAGEVVGHARTADNDWRAFIWDEVNGMRPIDPMAELPGTFELDRAWRINDAGWIAGDGHYGPNWGTSRGFVLKPTEFLSTCPTDLTLDGATDFADLNLVLGAYGTPDADADVNLDGVVDFEDLNLVLSVYGQPCP